MTASSEVVSKLQISLRGIVLLFEITLMINHLARTAEAVLRSSSENHSIDIEHLIVEAMKVLTV